ncbi:Mitochondrial substrate carrier family protein isoform 2 [Hibiscus syriacus]|uniref:Mitochondrial substrate carrier family protein isoform 2 n=1 Tax=Hibiscus syriacus TaxID=106335 RepID=A0A6A2WGU6_HIBSY|nr:Mitochondrial substrate carrier family protein isoform 2 [Hibiscus syriacus]
MGSPQGSTLTTDMTGLVDGSTARSDVSFIDCLPVYVKELIAAGAAGGLTRTDGFQSLGVYLSLRKVLKHECVMGFYKGNGASVTRIIPYAALHFITYEQYGGWILDNCTFFGSGPLVDLIAGSCSGGTAVVDTRTKFSSGMTSLYPRPAYSGIRDLLTTVYKEGGIRGLYRGPTLAGILPYAGLKFYIYETFTYPLDVARRQMQVESLQSSSIQGDTRYRNTYDGLTTIVRNQGWRQLFAGLSINYIKIVPSVAVGFAAYDMMKVWLRIPPRYKSQAASSG